MRTSSRGRGPALRGHTALRAGDTSLLMIDMQERLLPVIHDHGPIIENAVRLLTAAREMSLPVIVTEQYPKGIGPTTSELAELIPPGSPVLAKVSFSCCGAPGFDAALVATGRSTVVAFGVETHVCVLTTVMDLLARGYRVVLAADACGSRAHERHVMGIDAARDLGALVVPTETVVYQMLGRAGTPQFKALLPLFR